MEFGEAKDQRQANRIAGPVDQGRSVITEPLKDGRAELCWEARAGILDRHQDARAVGSCAYPDWCPGGVCVMALASNSWRIRSALLASKGTVAEVATTSGHLPCARHGAAARWTSVAMSTG